MYLDGDVFKKYFKGRNKELQQKEIIQKAIFETTSIEIIDKNIKIKNNTITILTSPMQKSEIILNKESVLKKISEKGYSFETIF